MAETVGSSFCKKVFGDFSGVSPFMCINLYKLYIDFTKTGNVEQELPLQNMFFVKFQGFQGRQGSFTSFLYKINLLYF